MRRIVLKNGLRVLLLERRDLPVVSVQALYTVGSRNEAPGITGVAHYVEHMAFRSTKGIAKQDLTNQILRWGGRWNGYTSYDQTTYGSHTPSQYLDWLLFLERERMDRVVFSADEVNRERTSVIAELRQYENSPAYTLVEHRMRRAAFVAHPYGSPIMGWISDLNGVTAAELERFYRQYYAPNNLVIAIVGRFEPAQAVALVRKHFGDATASGHSTALRTVEPEQHGVRRVVHGGPGSAKYLEMAFHAPALSSETFATLLVLDGVLAGGKTPGRASARAGSRLRVALVDAGLATDLVTEVEPSQYPGLFSIGVETTADADLSAIEARLSEVLDRVARSVSQREVDRAADQIRAAMTFGADSNRAIANLLAVYEGIGSYRLHAELPARLASVTPEMVQEFAARHLAGSRRTVGWFVPDDQPDRSGSIEKRSNPDAAVAPPPATLPPAQTAPFTRAPQPVLVAPALPVPAIRTLANGLTVLALPMPADTVHVRMRIEAGAIYDPREREGTALLAARLLDLASTDDSHQSAAAILEDMNIRFEQSAYEGGRDPFANRHFVEFEATLLKSQLDRALAVLGNLVMRPEFSADRLEGAKEALRAEVAGRQDDTRWRAYGAALERLFPGAHPYGRAVEGTPSSLQAITQADLVAFHDRHYTPARAVVAVAGGIDDTEKILAAVDQVFSGWTPSTGKAVEPTLASAAGEGGRIHVPFPHKNQATIVVGLPGVARSDAAYPALAALNYLLGETGYAGRLGESLVDTGISYSVYSVMFAGHGPGPILITTDSENSTEAVRRMLAALQGFADGAISDRELREAKGFLVGRLLFRFESPAAATAAMADRGYYGAETDARQFAREVLALTVDQIKVVASRYYNPGRAVVAVAGR